MGSNLPEHQMTAHAVLQWVEPPPPPLSGGIWSMGQPLFGRKRRAVEADLEAMRYALKFNASPEFVERIEAYVKRHAPRYP